MAKCGTAEASDGKIRGKRELFFSLRSEREPEKIPFDLGERS